MATRWGIKQRVLFLALIPTITISILLGVYFIGIRLEDLSKALNDRGIAVASRLASHSEYILFARDTDALRTLARNTISKEISSVAFFNKKGAEIASAGKLSADIQPPQLIGSVQIQPNPSDNTIAFTAPITLPDVIIDDLPDQNQSYEDEALKTTVIGWVKVELDHRSTRLKEYQVLIHSALIGLLGLSISGLLALRLGYDVSQPIIEMTTTVEKIRDGILEARVNASSQWELGILESGINAMASSLQVAHEEMQNNIDTATADLRKTLQTIEVQNVELDLARKEAENATQVKSEFLASMSHELRTPLNGIIGFINILDKTTLNDSQRDYLHTIQKSARSLLSIINDILDFSKIEAGKLHLDLLPMDIRECVEDTLTLLGPSAHDKSLEIVPFIYSDVPSKINGDALRIKQVITNLVNNAIKFTHKGSVIIRVMLENENDHQVTLCISVTDTGIGLTEDQQKQLFLAFNQANPSITRKFGGTGLGLVICKKIVEQMHGTIELESEPGVGTTFWFTLQAEKIDDHNSVEESELQGIKILLYDKHSITRLALLHLLEQWGMNVTECDNMERLPELVNEAKSADNPFSIALVGINQVLDERTLLSTVECPVGVLVNTTEHAVHKELLQAGAALCLAKPVCRKKLYDALCNVLFIGEQELGLPTLQQLPDLKVLAVDDNQANLKLVNVFLENIGVIPTLAQSGYEALQLCKEQAFDLILMDLHMPGLDGIETTVQIRSSDSDNANIPIVALSAHVLINEQDNIKAAGMNDFLTKPIDENRLRASIYKWTHSGVRSDKESSMETQYDTDLKTIDWPLGIKLAGKNQELAQEMLDMLVTGLPTDHTNIKVAYSVQDYGTLRDHVHRLHGACCYVGVPRLKAIAKALETAVATHSVNNIDLYMQKLDQEIAALLQEYTEQTVGV